MIADGQLISKHFEKVGRKTADKADKAHAQGGAKGGEPTEQAGDGAVLPDNLSFTPGQDRGDDRDLTAPVEKRLFANRWRTRNTGSCFP